MSGEPAYPLHVTALAALWALALLAPAAAFAQPVEFNRDIRPILSDRCFPCHGPDAANRKTKLRFDLESGFRIPLANGRFAIVPGDPGQSEMVRRIAADNTAVRMPPAYAGKEQLKPGEIELIRRWIAQGAHWQPFWSLIPPQRPAVPAVQQRGFVRSPIDAFILSRLEREGLHPSPQADPATLIRRVTLDLTGLAPTPAEVDAFLADTSPAAYEKVVDRLLRSPRYGERMAFRWMENARYGDTNGYQTDGPREMWRWRDWVVAAFNRNMPFSQFTIEQLAGDLLPNPTLDQLIATGFNRNHRTNGEGGIIPEEYRVEYVADRAQTTSIVWMGLTLGCARCHDHKFDPIAQKDFYRFFAFFNQIPNEQGFAWNYGNEDPRVKAPLPDQTQKLAELDRQIAEARRRFEALRPAGPPPAAPPPDPDFDITKSLVYRSPTPAPEHFDGKRFIEEDGKVADFDYMQPFTYAAWIRPESPKGAIVSHAEDFFEGMGHGLYLIDGKVRLHIHRRWTDLGIRVETTAAVPLFQWQHVLVTYDGERKAAGVRIYLNGEPQQLKVLFDQNNEPIHHPKTPLRIGAGGGLRWVGDIADVRIYNRALTADEAAIVPIRESIAEISAMPAARRSRGQALKLSTWFLEEGAPAEIRNAYTELTALEAERQQLYRGIPTVMVMADGAARDTFVLKRGAYDSPGEKVTSGVPEVLHQLPADWPNNRLGLARWLVDRGNPLTARVTVNRLWQTFFGVGIVKTVDDFGSQGEWPVHPELLDWLAVEFMDSGWDVKALIKTMVLSATYRQLSKVTPELLQKDPDNRLLARAPRYRLGPEMIRDQALAVSGLLVEKLGGPSVKPYQPPGLWQELASGGGYKADTGEGLYRRSLYTYWKRTVAPPFMVNFDSPNREQCTVSENRTNSPLQALDLMNDVAFLESARNLAKRMLVDATLRVASARISYGYRLLLARPPAPAQLDVLLKMLDTLESTYRRDPAAAREFLKQGESPVPSNLDVSELAAYTALASLLLNLDETITKQ
ncbi:MAG TPA: DUF1553 domain-containing protein [Candidatus Acidoferrales bacterium]|jgi:hypothetical protein|nr:DUF1553 domain-containing protein [Candidatus Acidoferrales bacterium]